MLKSKYCVLRSIEEADRSISIEWRNDPEVRDQALGHPFPVTAEMEDQWFADVLADQKGTRASFAIVDTTDNKLVGFTHLQNIDRITGAAEFAISIGERDRQGRGIGRAATELMLEYGFNTLNLSRIALRVVATNMAARSLYEKLGFENEGCLRQAAFINGQYQDVLLFSILRK